MKLARKTSEKLLKDHLIDMKGRPGQDLEEPRKRERLDRQTHKKSYQKYIQDIDQRHAEEIIRFPDSRVLIVKVLRREHDVHREGERQQEKEWPLQVQGHFPHRR